MLLCAEPSEAAETGDHEVDDLVVVALLVDVGPHGAEGLVQDRYKHVDDDEGDRHHEEEDEHLRAGQNRVMNVWLEQKL